MRYAQRHVANSTRGGYWLRAAPALLAAIAVALVFSPPARAATGYELNASTPSRSLGPGKVPHGIAVDQANQRIYVAILTVDTAGGFGEIDRFESNLSAAGVFSPNGGYFTGVAVNPVTQGFYAAQALVKVAGQQGGIARMDTFSSTGTAGATFPLSDTGTFPQIATDSAGNVFYPDAATHTVRVFNSAGVLQEEITCSGCPGGSSFGKPVSLALDSEDDLYVVDLNPDRVVKLTSSGAGYSYAATLQSGLGAVAVGVDPSNDDVLVGDLPNGAGYHIVAYDSSGVQFDDFGGGMFADPEPLFGPLIAPQLAVDATSRRVYVGEIGSAKFYIFDRVSPSNPPTATIKPAAPVGQITAKVKALVNPRSHTVLDCDFEYVDDADFQADGFSNASTKPCAKFPSGSGDTPAEASLSGLSPVTTYHYRVTATTFVDSVSSAGETFQTLPVVPATVTTKPAQSITQSGATLSATVNPHGGSISSCRFEYGTTTSYGSSLSCTKLPEAVAEDVAVSRPVSGLTPGAEYHFRPVVTSNAGTVQGNDVTFKTVAPPQPEGEGPPPPTTPPPTTSGPPPVVTTPPPPKPLRCKKGFQRKRVKGKLKCVKKKRHAKRRRAHRGR